MAVLSFSIASLMALLTFFLSFWPVVFHGLALVAAEAGAPVSRDQISNFVGKQPYTPYSPT